jgi:hypothetical protein
MIPKMPAPGLDPGVGPGFSKQDDDDPAGPTADRSRELGEWIIPRAVGVFVLFGNLALARTISRTARIPARKGVVFEAGPKTSFLFDLDGTLVDSVYQHVLAWREALAAE